MITFSSQWLRDRIYACWLGKNIGGTLGTPYEGGRQINDITGFKSKPGEPLPNDDLDLQLVWLRAMSELGPEHVDAQALGEYWLSYITPHWNEYGIGKSNMAEGFLPPLSGELYNDAWKHSNGAWIRTEIWSCLYPANVEQAIRYAYEDASVDHGLNEGTYAAIFVAAMESSAFVVSDSRKLLEIGLSKIPEDCRVARSVNIAAAAYDKGLDWQQARSALVEDSQDLGWFQAPANVGFVVIGLLYGGGDFKKSLILAVNCGDDTDCTAATLGSLLGIMQGLEGIPGDWRAYIGDDIKTISLMEGHGRFPQTCAQLTGEVMNLLPVTMRKASCKLGGENDFSRVKPEDFMGRKFIDSFAGRSPWSFAVENIFVKALVEYEGKPSIAPNGQLKGRITLSAQRLPGYRHFNLRWILPDGWKAEGVRHLHCPASGWRGSIDASCAAFTITAGEVVDGLNEVIVEVSCTGRPARLYIPMTVLG